MAMSAAWKYLSLAVALFLFLSVFVLGANAADHGQRRGGRVRGLQGQGQGNGNSGAPPGLSRKGGDRFTKQVKRNAKTGKVTGQELAALKSKGNLKNSFQAELQSLCGKSTFQMNGCDVSFDLKDLTPTKSPYVFENTVSCDETVIIELIPSLTYLPQAAFMIAFDSDSIFELVSLPHVEDVGCTYTVISDEDVDTEALSRFKFGADSKGNSAFGQGGGNGGGNSGNNGGGNPGNGGNNGNSGGNQNGSSEKRAMGRGRRFIGGGRRQLLRSLLGTSKSSHSSREIVARDLQATCGEPFRYIRLAVYYDSSFCLDFGGGTELGSRAHIDAIIAAMNQFFLVEGICLQIDVCEYDGECSSTLDPAEDPFLELLGDSDSVCATNPVLENFKAFFANPEPQAGCDIRHLFYSLDPFPDSDTLGCAFLPGLCDEFAYAVNHVGFTKQIGFQAILVAHELGHNLNAVHTIDDCDTCIMDATLGGTEEEFAPTAAGAITNFVVAASKGSDTCTATSEVSAPTLAPAAAPAPSISTDRSCYEVGDPIFIDWFYESCQDGDWIGIYPESETNPLGGDWLLWVYARSTTQNFDFGCNLDDFVIFFDNSVAGTATWPLPEGTYRTWIARDDSEPYTAVLAGPSFEIASTCNLPGCVDDPDWRWTNDRGRTRGCARLASRPDRYEQWCPQIGDFPDTRTGFEACPKACFNCPDATLAPTSPPPTALPSSAPSTTPSTAPSEAPSDSPSMQPSNMPSTSPSDAPSNSPSSAPSSGPSDSPSSAPSSQPSNGPSNAPSSQPSGEPSNQPSGKPSISPSGEPSDQPSLSNAPTPLVPTAEPSNAPSLEPSSTPSDLPSSQPSQQPSNNPSETPSVSPSVQPSGSPSDQPSHQPSDQPSTSPSEQPSASPSDQPSASPSDQPSVSPSSRPSASPSDNPSSSPSSSPSGTPSMLPSQTPSDVPTDYPITADLPDIFTACMTCDENSCNYDSSCTLDNSCTANGGTCELCEGDCDIDSDCAGSLVCYQRDRGDFQPVPGCDGGENDGSRTDYCVEPFTTIETDQDCYARGAPITVCFDYTEGRKYDWIGCYDASETSPLGDDYLLWVYTTTLTQHYSYSIGYNGCVTFDDSSFGAWPLSNGIYKCWIARDDGCWTGIASTEAFQVGFCPATQT